MSQVVLSIPDQHFPFQHKDTIPFLKKVKETFNPNIVVNIGDELDFHCISFHDTDPDQPYSASSELERAAWQLSALYDLFPECHVMESNHGSLHYRRGKAHGLPRGLFKSYNEIINAPKEWRWMPELVLDTDMGKVCFRHQGKTNALTNSKDRAMSFIQGHFHSKFDLQYWSNGEQLFFGMTIGSLIDNEQMTFNYNKLHLGHPISGCGLLIDGVPLLLPMKVNAEKRWIGIL